MSTMFVLIYIITYNGQKTTGTAEFSNQARCEEVGEGLKKKLTSIATSVDVFCARKS